MLPAVAILVLRVFGASVRCRDLGTLEASFCGSRAFALGLGEGLSDTFWL